ncbi:hypothetical protein [Streptomyces fradiae]|uniref:hypothetical protein n=1 Tax=Streptomyces fradiae TaxID=1906 RepID=UPI0029420FE9|nr:hypothetical protein [Streptomyces fradiae]WOI61845.1 hypothetical protein RYQ63_19140 [Streptomyces fradiae]
MRPRIVYVHGCGPKPRAELLRAEWDRALLGRDANGTSFLAYWAPLLHPEPLPDREPDPMEGRPGAAARAEAGAVGGRDAGAGSGAAGGRDAGVGSGAVGAESAGESFPPPLEDPARFVARAAAEAAEAVRGRAGRPGGAAPGGAASGGTGGMGETGGEAASAAEGRTPGRAGGGPLDGWLRDMAYLAEALALAEEPRPGPGAEPLPSAPSLARPGRTALFRNLVRRVYQDVHAYFLGGAGPAVRQAVADALDAAEAGRAAEGGGPLVVVGHGLGSVAAYEVLAERGQPVDLFVTIGSPLGSAEVQGCLAAPPAVPSGTALWLNASDARDLVALDHTLRPDFAPPGRVTDVLVRNVSAHHHGAADYLSDPLVQGPVHRVLGRIA